MSTANEDAPSYSTLEAIRAAHDQLLQSLPDDEAALPEEARRANEARIQQFISYAIDCGVQLDSSADRKVAQGLIDYWVASAYAASRDRSSSWILPPRSALVLKPFDTAKMKEAAERADAIINDQDPHDQELARQIIMHLIRLSPDKSCRLIMQERNKLLSLGDVQRTDRIVSALARVGALKLTPAADGDRVELGYEALIRYWPRLDGWIEDRLRFREWAEAWDESKRDHGALISNRSLLKQTDAFDDLSKLELEYKQQSIKSLDKLRRRSIAITVCTALVIIGLIPLYRQVQVLRENRERVRAEAAFPENIWIVKSKDSTPTQKRQAFLWLVDNQPRVMAASRNFDLTGANLVDLDLHGISMRGPNLTNATLEGVNFDKSNLPSARFNSSQHKGYGRTSDGQLKDTRFVDAVMPSAKFDGSMLSSVKFNGAKLTYASFDHVRFCGNVDFSGADIRRASFQNVIFDPSSSLPEFANTVWWLAEGWSLAQTLALSDRFANFQATQTKGFDDEIREHDTNIKNSKVDSVDLAEALNGKGWTLATFGVSDGEALETTNAAIAIATKLRLSDGVLANYQDTLAYILLQQGKTAEALKLLQDIINLGNQPSGVLFRYAVALNAEQRQEEAIEALTRSVSISIGNYSPSHELFLLRKYINGKFKAVLSDLLAKRRVPDISKPPPCPGADEGKS